MKLTTEQTKQAIFLLQASRDSMDGGPDFMLVGDIKTFLDECLTSFVEEEQEGKE